jgi:tetratricopeptide (TPR) repeat protein
MRRAGSWIAILVMVVLGAPLAVAPLGAAEGGREPLYDGLGSYRRKVTVRSAEARRYLDQGMGFLYGFNLGAARRAFTEAARIEPDFAMAHWGVAMACGPHINYPLVTPEAGETAWKEVGLARSHAASASPVERALIEAVARRYAERPAENRAPLDSAYADAMRAAWKAHPKDPDVGAFFAEALMNLRPWDQWTLAGQPQPGTDEVLATLDAVLELAPKHPFANHLYIHAVEASPHPERALEAANRLRKLQPGLAHNVHMPSHIDIRTGRWQEAIAANEAAVAADARYRATFGEPRGFLPVYVAHDRHMLAYAAMMTGQRELALNHIRAMVAELTPEFLEEFAFAAEAFLAMPDEVMVRFGMWDEILAQPFVPESQPFSHAFRRAANGIALAATGDTIQARLEQAAFVTAAARVPAEWIAAGNNTAHAVLAVVRPMLEGEILIREGRIDAGIDSLRAAVAAEDLLRYDEPPGWLIPVRHTLGAALFNAGRHAQAEQVYRDDLARLPNDGWALYGLAQSLARQDKGGRERKDVEARFKKAWARADTKLTSSCLCQPMR